MTPEELAVIQAAMYLRFCIDAKTAGDPPRLGGLLDKVDALIFACPKCNSGGHQCPGDGKSIPHGATDCGAHGNDVWPLAFAARTWTSYPCRECLTDPTEDPAPWCDCRDDERCIQRSGNPCRKRAHSPSRCPNAPLCGDDGGIGTYPPCTKSANHIDAHSWVEEWVAATWVGYVREGDTVRIGTATAVVETTDAGTAGQWHIDPQSSRYQPRVWLHDECHVRLAGRKDRMEFPPNGPVEILMGEERQAVWALQVAFGTVTAVEEKDVQG